jgi:peptidoglycan/LPS O-acetylase OafA/YrhL
VAYIDLSDRGDPKHFRYLAFVDGLRAVSILAVVGFHIGLPGFSGGFVGVDVFFVISGFLIINQIKDGLTAGYFSILSFYTSRILRILPPFLVMVAAVDLAAPLVLGTTALSWSFLPSAGLAPLMASNIVFLATQEYFDISAVEKPFLHTWTLSVEEQFYLCAPLLLILVFWLGKRRFGAVAVAVGSAMAAASFLSAAAQHGAGGHSAAFYLPHARAWEFLAGGFIGGRAASAIRSMPHVLVDLAGWAGLGCILLAVFVFNSAMPYLSWYAALPVAGASLVILCGLARPETMMARFLSRRWMVTIGVVSYGWYLWHWPILSFMRIARLGDGSLPLDTLGGGLVALTLAGLSYRYVELPIRRWKKSPANMSMRQPGRILLCAVAACFVVAAVGEAGAVAGWLSTRSFLAARYGVDGRGVLDDGCQRVNKWGLPDQCFEGPFGILLGDSHASVLAGSFAKNFEPSGIRLVSIAGPGCRPTLFAPWPREENRRHECARAIAPFERLLARPELVRFVIMSSRSWGHEELGTGGQAMLLADLISQFDPQQTRILLLGPVPDFPRSSLECVVFSDRFGGSRDRCVTPRREAEDANTAVTAMLKAMAAKFGNVRYVDPLAVFCDETTCWPFSRNGKDAVFFLDTHHVLPRGADEMYDAFETDFRWLVGDRGKGIGR